MNTCNNIPTSRLIDMAFHAWSGWSALRNMRHRHKLFTYGRQWEDLVISDDGSSTTERLFAESHGRHPMTNNMIRQLVKSIIGNFRNSLRSDDPASQFPLPAELQHRNSLSELDCRLLEEFLISGCAIQRIVNERRLGGDGVWIDNVDPASFFVNKFRDPRGMDIELVGMIHSMSLREVLMRFAESLPDSEARRRKILQHYAAGNSPLPDIDSIDPSHANLFFSCPDARCRVIELWTLESRNMLRCHDPLKASAWISLPEKARNIADINATRLSGGLPPVETRSATTLRWHCRFLTPSGLVLDEYDSPYPHCSHPFVVKLYPLLDGEVHPFVEDIIDQQKNINRLITMIDHILSVSAKGALLYPVNLRPDGLEWKDIQDRWAAGESIIPYVSRPGAAEPRQIFSAGESPGAYHLLELEMQLFKQISGVGDALQGQFARSATSSAALCEAEWRLGLVAVLDIIDTFNSFRCQRNIKVLQS